MWWLLGLLIFTGVFWGATRRTTVNNYNETYVDAECDGGGCGDGDCGDSYYDGGNGGNDGGGSNE